MHAVALLIRCLRRSQVHTRGPLGQDHREYTVLHHKGRQSDQRDMGSSSDCFIFIGSVTPKKYDLTYLAEYL